jgi:2-iminoacetate synthase ThiH
MDPRLQKIEQKIAAGERLDRDDALALFTTEDLFAVGRKANGKKERNAIGWARKRNPRQIPSRA